MPPDPILLFAIADDAPQGAPLLTLPGGVGLYRRRAAAQLRLSAGDEVIGTLALERCYVRLGSDGDQLLDVLLGGAGNQDTQDFDLKLAWSSRSGVSIGGGAGLQLTLPVRARLPVVQLRALHVVATPSAGASTTLGIELSADLSASLAGVIDVSVERLGVVADLIVSGQAPPDAVAAGPVRVAVRFKPPTGAGLSVNLAGVIEGGGFLSIDPARGQYAGLISLNLFGIGVTAAGIVTSRPSFSLLAIITANFKPVGLDIGFGFTINAVGGIVGLHRSADLGALAEGVRTNAIASVMFPPNPLADAPRIINDMGRLFPRLDNAFVVGPLMEMGWGKPAGMIALGLGVVVEVPDAKFAILGMLRVVVPPGTDLAPLRLQVNFVGSVDFGRRFLRFDASLVDSRLALYTLDGDMAARLRWGAGANFAVTVGGFHPRFTPAADLELTSMRRVSVNLLPTKNNPRLRLDSYYAATTNTLQHGASIDAYAAIAGFGIKGHLGYDVLVQLNPVRFDASISGEVTAIAFDEEIFSTRFDLQLTGPSPWHARGEASFKFIVKRVRIPVNETFGSADAPVLPAVPLAEAFTRQVENVRNWVAASPGHSQVLVVLRPSLSAAADDDFVLAHPSATIEFNQHAMPLGVIVQRFGAAPITAPTQIDITSLRTVSRELAREPVKTEFAPAQYFDLTPDQRLVEPAFREMLSGARASPAELVAFGKETVRLYGYESHVFDKAAVEPIPGLLKAFVHYDLTAALAVDALGGSAVGRSDMYRERVNARPSDRAIEASAERFVVIDAATMRPEAALAASESYGAATQALEGVVANNPELASRLVIVSEHELV
jgi:hypothetical protein